MVTVAIIALCSRYGMPTFSTWMQNSQPRQRSR
jgi:Tfp pilus assembly protein FimT